MDDITLTSAPVTWQVANQIQGPQARGANGYVEFEAEAVAVHHGGLMWLPSPQRAEVKDGVLEPIDLPINDPDVWNWKITPYLGVHWPPFHVNVEEGGTNLSSAAIVPGKGPVRVLQGPQGGSVVGAEDQGDGTIRFVLDDGTRTAPMPITRGPAGPANEIEVGTVIRGDEPYASLVGEAPHQVLNLVLPKGDPGDPNELVDATTEQRGLMPAEAVQTLVAATTGVEALRSRMTPIDGLTEAPVYLYVDGALGNDETGDGSTGAKFATIQRAVDSIPKLISQDHLIRVQAGVYDEDVYIRGIAGANLAIQKAGADPTDVTQPTGVQVRSIEALDLPGRLLIEWLDMINAEGIQSATTAPMRFSRCGYISLRGSRFTSNTRAGSRPAIDFDGSTGSVSNCYFNDQFNDVLAQNGSQVKVYDTNVHGSTKSGTSLRAIAATISKHGDQAWARNGAATPESRSRGGMINDDAWTAWTPSFPASGEMSFTDVSISHARYTVIGKTCFYVLRAAGRTSGGSETSIQYTLPIPAQLDLNAALGGSVIVNDGGFDAGWQILSNRTTVQVRKVGANNPWGLGTDRRIYVSGTYEIA